MTISFDIAQCAQALPASMSLAQCRLDDDRDIRLASAWSSLSATEQSRAKRFRLAKYSARYIRGRGFMRQILGQRLGCAARDVALTQGPYHKPELCHPGPGFNLSHSQDIALLAIREDGDIGLDLELCDRVIDPLHVARSCFQDHEFEALCALPDAARPARFFDFWTAKEALMKLTGAGMHLDPKSIALRLEDGSAGGYQAPAAHRCVKLIQPKLGPDLHVSIAWGDS